MAYAHLNHAACNLHGLGCDKRSPPISSQNSTDSPIYGGTRLSRPQSRWFCKCLCMVKRGRIVRSTFFPGLFCVARRVFRVFRGKKYPFQVDTTWMKQRASQPQNHSPCPRASVHSVLTGRRPAVRHAPKAARVHRAPNTLYPLAHTLKHISYRQNNVSIWLKFAIIRHWHHSLLPSPR